MICCGISLLVNTRKLETILKYFNFIYFRLYCSEPKVGIELDGSVHKVSNQKSYDFTRDKEINARYGIRIIRFWNGEVKNHLEIVLEKILRFIRNKIQINFLTPGSLNRTFPLSKWRGGQGIAVNLRF